jgi:dihydrofolate reductase
MSQISDSTRGAPPFVGPEGPRICLVAAVARNGVIGAGGKLPWHLPEDLRHFRQTTLGHPVIMGRRTWASIGKPLPGRENIVVSRCAGFEAPGARVATSLEDAIAFCAGKPAAFVIGGSALYAAALPLADALLLTEIDRDYDGDTRFPDWDRAAWRASERERHTSAAGVPFEFVRYLRCGRPGGKG